MKLNKNYILPIVIFALALSALALFHFIPSIEKAQNITVSTKQKALQITNTSQTSSSSVDITGKHIVSPVDEQKIIFTLPSNHSTNNSVLENVRSALGIEIKPSRSGRTGSELHFPQSTTLTEARKQLEAYGLGDYGQLKTFRFQSNHNHELCGTCLMTNFQELYKLSHVQSVPYFLGDENNNRIDIVVSSDSDVETQKKIISVLEHDHLQSP